MKTHYDFSKGEKGKFYVPEDEFESPIYLDKSNQNYFMNLADTKKIGLSKLINNILKKDKSLLNIIYSE